MKLRIRTEREHKGYLVRVWRDWVEVAYLVLARVNTEALEAISAIVAALARAQALHDADPMRAAAEAGKSVPVRRVA